MSGHHAFGDQLFEALTKEEIIQLLDAVWVTLSSDWQDEILKQLQPDTRQTIQNLLSPAQPSGVSDTNLTQPVSTAKLAQTWAKLWHEWHDIVENAAQEDGPYITQEADWEAPYFDEYGFVSALEGVATKMRPLLQQAVKNNFSPDIGFATALLAAEEEISTALPEWMEMVEGFLLEENLTYCLLEREWLKSRSGTEETFAFAQHILEWENTFDYTALESDTVLDFCTQLPEGDQRNIFEGLEEHKDSPPWKRELDNVYSHWHIFYMCCIEQFVPERYLDSLRAIIPHQWQNGLPVIEDLLTKQDYETSLLVVEETLKSMLTVERIDESWTVETSLLFVILDRFSGDAGRLKNHQTLLDFFHQTAVGLNNMVLANALSLQCTAFDHFFDWKIMFKTFADVSVSEQVRQALFASWQEYNIQRAKPYTWGFGAIHYDDIIWWLHWLIESIVDKQKGPAWFQSQIDQWLTQLPHERHALGQDFDHLRLLTKDLVQIGQGNKSQYPKFYEVVVRPTELSTPNQSSRQWYLKQYVSPDLLDRVMIYWRTNLNKFVPRPEHAQNSDYTQSARWMAALRELAPSSYETLLNHWQSEHHRRRNLWQAMAGLGLE